MKKLLLALIGISTIFISCDNEMDIYADDEESMVVFGIINPRNTEHYIKVQKSFQEEGKEAEAALDTSKIYYGDNEISVYIDRYIGGVKNDSFEFSPVWISDRDSGSFAHPNNKVYKFSTPVLGTAFLGGESSSSYKLRVVKHNGEEDVVSVGTIGLSNPIFLNKPKFTTSVQEKAVNLYDSKTEFAWTQADGDIETFNFRFHYVEENINSNQRDTLFIDYNLFEGTPTKDNKSIFLNSSDFLKRLAVRIKANDEVIRFPLNVQKNSEGILVGYPMELDIWSAQKDLSDYLTVNNSTSIGLVESNISYSNIENGFGLFSSRMNYNINSNKGINALYFNRRSLDSLSCSVHTRALNFVKYSIDPSSTEVIYDASAARCN